MAMLPSFTELVHGHQSMVFSIALRALGNRAVAEDLTQEVFLSLHENLSGIESEEHARRWLRRAVVNRTIDEMRRRQRRRGPSLEEIAEPAVSSEESDPFLLDQLRKSVRALPPLARMLTILRFQEEMEPREIAAQLDIPVATVKSRLHRTMKILRGKLERQPRVRSGT
ncbi:RNA polymerase sigma factor [Bryobacter aggregatus]|uniref:RNA polymerase sigma factor n=1 Tax=Bryobacter aggregatus TaxID=360054 RepID=UPI0004E0B768|nr:sigma-70 family RNA polymerase sigma factor [Bryobacter aggregatus]